MSLADAISLQKAINNIPNHFLHPRPKRGRGRGPAGLLNPIRQQFSILPLLPFGDESRHWSPHPPTWPSEAEMAQRRRGGLMTGRACRQMTWLQSHWCLGLPTSSLSHLSTLRFILPLGSCSDCGWPCRWAGSPAASPS